MESLRNLPSLEATVGSLVQWTSRPSSEVFKLPRLSLPIYQFPFEFQSDLVANKLYPLSLSAFTPALVSVTYFLTIKGVNKVVKRRQIAHFKEQYPGKPIPSNPKKLPAAPYKIATTRLFKLLVLLHNVFLCAYSVWTLVGMVGTINANSHEFIPDLIEKYYSHSSKLSSTDMFWQSVCDLDHGIWYNKGSTLKGLSYYSYLFYLSKYYEILDTVIILLKGRQSSLLQTYHHSGAILSMWAGTRYASAPIWIFVVFNSFIHSIMYFYFSLSCVHIRLPSLFKQVLTSLQISQFVLGGSLAVVHMFISYFDVLSGSYQHCISTSEQALAIFINVFYLTPLTFLFAAFYVDSYRKGKAREEKEKGE